MSKPKMEGVDNFAGCLKILENQGFQAEQRLLVQLFDCIETYWNTSVVESLYIPKDIPSTSLIVAKKSLVEEGEIELSEDELLLEENVIEVKSEKVLTKKKKKTEQVEKETSPNSEESLNSGDLEEQPPSLEDLFSLGVEGENTLKKKVNKASGAETNQELVTSSDCRYCDFKVAGKKTGGKYSYYIRKHNRTEHFVCEICRKKHDSKDGLDVHMNSLHKDMEGMVICGVNRCKNKTKRLQAALAHVRHDHDGVPVERRKKKGRGKIFPRNTKVNPEVISSQCKYCPFKMSGRKYKLRMHNKTEHFVCEICEKKHDNKDGLDVHMNSLHTDIEGRVICGVNGCNKKLRQLNIALEHVRLHHKRVADRICKDCNKPYLRLRNHRIQHHIDPSSLKSCTVCGYTCLSKNSLLMHTKLRHPKPGSFSRKFQCSFCDFETSGLSQEEEFKLIMHKRIHQGGVIICTMCPYKTEKPYSLNRHLAEEHNIGFLFQCNQCEYKTGGLTAKGHMKTHMIRHSDEKNFQCDQCEYAGHTKASLNKHLQRHNPNGPMYLCDECEYKSTDRSNFKAHKQVKHGSVVLSCEECDYSTKSRRSLREHKRKHLTSLSSFTYLGTDLRIRRNVPKPGGGGYFH